MEADSTHSRRPDLMPTTAEIRHAAELIRQGGLVAFPTETVYGLGANALDPDAVTQIFELKGRPRFDPLIVHVADPSQLDDLVQVVPQAAKDAINRFWPGPLSVVLPKRNCVPDIVTAGLPNVAVRCPAHPVARQLIEEAGVPIAAPSANKFCAVSPTTARHVIDQFGDRISVVLDGGPSAVGVESSVVSFVNEAPVMLRPGGVTPEELQDAIGPVQPAPVNDSAPASPGQLPRHYAPSTPLRLSTESPDPDSKVGLLAFGPPEKADGFAVVEVLSDQKYLKEAAANLFAAMRRLDGRGLDYIIARPVPEEGLGHAIMDRLRRASKRP